MKTPERALFIQLRRVGDVLMCTPAIRAFKNKFPICRLDFLTELPDVLKQNPRVDSVIPIDASRGLNPFYQASLIRKIRKIRYDLAVDFFANPRSAYYSFLSGAECRLSYGYGHRRWAYNIVPEKAGMPVYAAQDRLNLLAALDIPSDSCRLEFYPADSDREEAQRLLKTDPNKSLLTISPVSRRAFNRWPLERYARVTKTLLSDFEFDVAILTGPGERQVAGRLAELMAPVKPLVLHIERLGLLGAVLERAGLHIGNDNGPKHIAVACGAPTFTIYGPHSHVSWTYPDSSRHGFITPAEADPDCKKENHKCGPECINRITVNAVIEKLIPFIHNLKPVSQTLGKK